MRRSQRSIKAEADFVLTAFDPDATPEHQAAVRRWLRLAIPIVLHTLERREGRRQLTPRWKISNVTYFASNDELLGLIMLFTQQLHQLQRGEARG